MEAIETPHVQMRSYGNTYSSWSNGHAKAGPQPFLTYSRFAEGIFLATPESAIIDAMPAYRQHMREQIEKGVYRLPRGKGHLIDADAETIYKAMLKGIKSEKETTKLATASDKIDGYMGHDVLTGNVPSRSSGVRSTTLSRWPVVIKSPLFSYDGSGINYSALHCGCQDFEWGIAKDTSFVCAHIAAEIKTAYDEQSSPETPEDQKRISYFKTDGQVYLPYNIDLLDAIDVVFRRYVINQSSKHIDRTELGRPEAYEPLFLQDIYDGHIVYEAVRQANKKIAPKTAEERRAAEAVIRAEDNLRRTFLYGQLKDASYEKTGLYALEFPGTPWETMCETYTRGSEVVRPVFNWQFPPLLVYWQLNGDSDVFGQKNAESPFALVGTRVADIDDRSRRKGIKQVFIPGPEMPPGIQRIPVNPVFRRDYVRLLGENNPDASELMRRYGLSLF